MVKAGKFSIHINWVPFNSANPCLPVDSMSTIAHVLHTTGDAGCDEETLLQTPCWPATAQGSHAPRGNSNQTAGF
jgi:hypothetical protein